MAQEALANAAHHAHPTPGRAHLSYLDDEVALDVGTTALARPGASSPGGQRLRTHRHAATGRGAGRHPSRWNPSRAAAPPSRTVPPDRPAAVADGVTGAAIRVLMVDDHPVVRDGLCGMFGSDPDFVVVGEAADGAAALRLAQTLPGPT